MGRTTTTERQRQKRKAQQPEPEEGVQVQIEQDNTNIPLQDHNNITQETEASKSSDFTILTDILTSAQDGRKHANLKRKLKNFYYRYTDLLEAASHQKFCTSTMWRLMVVPFYSEKSRSVDNVIRLFWEVVVTLGTPEDIEEYVFPIKTLKPFFYYIMKYANRCHADNRIPVRVKVLETVEVILKKFENHEYFEKGSKLYDSTKAMLEERIQDKATTVRLIAVRCLKYFICDADIRKKLMFRARNDESAEIRSAAVETLKGQIDKVKIEVFLEQAYDINEDVSAEAFLALSQVKLKRIPKVAERQELVMFGLTYPSRKTVREVVIKHLLPNWLKDSENSIVKLMQRINPTVRLEVARAVIDALYSNNNRELDFDFDVVDKSFLNSHNIIPFEELTGVKCQVWFLLCEKFKGSDFFAKISPDGGDLCILLNKIIQLIREGEEPDDIDNFSDLEICLTYVLGLARFINAEEGFRRDIQKICEEIMLESKIGSTIVVFEVASLIHKLLENQYEKFVDDILNKIFNPFFQPEKVNGAEAEPELPKTPEIHRGRGSGGRTFCDNENAALTSTPKPTRTSRNEISLIVRECTTPQNEYKSFNISTLDLSHLDNDEKEKFADVNLKRHKLITRVDHLRKSGRNSEANKALAKVKEMDILLDEILVAGNKKGTENLSLDSEDLETEISEELDDIQRCSQTTTEGSDEELRYDLSDTAILKGLVLLTKSTSVLGKISKFLLPPQDDYLLHYLSNTSKLIRKYCLHAIYYIGLFDPEQAANSMKIMITGVNGDPDKCVRHAAFKCIVDMLIHYKMETFCRSEDDEVVMEPPLNNPNASNKELEEYFLSLLQNAFKEDEAAEDTVLKINAYVKLFLANRITSIDVLTGVMCIIVDPNFGPTLNTYTDYFVPLYLRSGLDNGMRAVQAFYDSMQQMLPIFEERDDPMYAVNITKFIESIFRQANLTTDPEYRHTLQAKLFSKVLKLVIKNPNHKFNLELLKAVNKLQIQDVKYADKIISGISTALNKLDGFAQSRDIAKVKGSLKTIRKSLEKDFPSNSDKPESEEEHQQPENEEDECNNNDNDNDEEEIVDTVALEEELVTEVVAGTEKQF